MSVVGTRMGTRGGGRAWAWRVTVTAGDRMTARRMPPPVAFWKGGVSPPTPVDHRRPVDSNGSNGGDKKLKSNKSFY